MRRSRMRIVAVSLGMVFLAVAFLGLVGCGEKQEKAEEAENAKQAFVDDMMQALSGRYGEVQPIASSMMTDTSLLAASIFPVEKR